ncbi:MAG: cell division protein FtsZ, partial [Bacteroidota bacterium]
IGEINDYIQAEAGQCANIIMGVGEDINLGESIAVTVIATGFNPEQQNEIVNTEAKKIIHTLEDEQRVNLNLMGSASSVEPPIYFDLECEAELVVPQATDVQPEPVMAYTHDEVAEEVLAEEPAASLFDTPLSEVSPEEPAITHVLDWSDEADDFGFDLSEEHLESELEVVSEDVLIPTTEALRHLEVYDFQVVAPAHVSAQEDDSDDELIEQEMEFHIIEKPTASVPPSVEEAPVFEEQTSLFFDLTIEEVQAPKISVPEELTSAQIWNLEVIDAEIVAPKAQRQEPAPSAFISEEAPAKRYSLEDYMELEQKLTQAQPEPKEAEVAELPEFQFEHKVIDTPLAQESSVEVDPMESPIADLLKARTEERKRQFKEFNYHFNNSLQRIDEIEKEPAYKRQGISLDQNPVEAKLSRTTLSADPNEEDRLRTNNSFLHDNVD